MLITLLRHGDVHGRAQVLRGHRDEPLSDTGWRQLQRVWDASTPAFTHIASSPLQRCLAFASQQATQHALPLTTLETLCEIDFGDWDGLTLAEAKAYNPDCFTQFEQDTFNWQPPNGESYRAFRLRVRSAIHTLHATQAHHLLVVTHGGVIRSLLCELLGLSPDSAARIGVPLGGYCQLWLDDAPFAGQDVPRASLLRLQWLDPICC